MSGGRDQPTMTVAHPYMQWRLTQSRRLGHRFKVLQ